MAGVRVLVGLVAIIAACLAAAYLSDPTSLEVLLP